MDLLRMGKTQSNLDWNEENANRFTGKLQNVLCEAKRRKVIRIPLMLSQKFQPSLDHISHTEKAWRRLHKPAEISKEVE
jgi:hypothetical protein